MHFGTINIGTLKDKTEEIIHTMEYRNLKILGLAETRLKGSGQRRLHDDFELFFSSENENTRHGVALILDPNIALFVERVLYINSRIIAITLNITDYKLSFIHFK